MKKHWVVIEVDQCVYKSRHDSRKDADLEAKALAHRHNTQFVVFEAVSIFRPKETEGSTSDV